MTAQFLAGAAKIDITPTDLSKTYLAGFGQNRKADRVLDPLYARAVYISDGSTEFALVAIDLIGLMFEDAWAMRAASGVMAPENVWICCTHTHAGPDTFGIWGPTPIEGVPLLSGMNTEYMKDITRAVGHVVRRAKKRARPAEARFGVDKAPKDRETWNVRNALLMDHDLSVMHLVRSGNGDSTIATLTNFASHPECLWEHNHGVSGDFVSPFNDLMEQMLGGVSIFVNGALGGMVTPGINEFEPYSDRLRYYRMYGKSLARKAIEAVKSAKPAHKAVLRLKEIPFELKLRNDQLGFMFNMGVLNRRIDGIPDSTAEVWPNVHTSVGILSLGPARFIAVPGECLPELGLQIKKMVGGDPCFFLGLCNDELGYLLPESYFADPEYHYEQSMSPGPHTEGEIKRMIEAVVSAAD
ncbi:hypothetical protein KDL45_00500 [bacterium]|nr:hypothetical protein [bacterium]